MRTARWLCRGGLSTLSAITLAAALTTPASAAASATGAATQAAGSAAQPAPLARFAALAGEWIAAEDGEMAKRGELVAVYEVTAGGSAVVETVFPGSQYEMVTVYTADGADLVLTHYCVNGNQPRMRARAPAADATRFHFALDGGGNLHAADDRHMHSARIDLVSADELRSEWTEHAGGKPILVVQMHLLRRQG